MLELFKTIYDSLRQLSPDDFAKFMAYWLAPGTVLVFTVSGTVGGSFAIDTGRPIAVSELRTEQSPTGATIQKPGFVLVIEPVASEFRIQLPVPPTRLWSSLDDATARANKDRLALDGSSVVTRAPFLGIGDPVTVVVDGQLGPEIQVPGGTEKTEDLILRSRRSVSVMTGVFLVCVFAFGMSSVTGLPSNDRKQHA
jgi:hypothetical protein